MFSCNKMKCLFASAALPTLFFIGGCTAKAPHMTENAPPPNAPGNQSLEQLYKGQECNDALLCRNHAVAVFKDPKTGRLTTTPADDHDKVIGVIMPPFAMKKGQKPEYRMFVFPEPKPFDEMPQQPMSMLSLETPGQAANYGSLLSKFARSARGFVASIKGNLTDDTYSTLTTITTAADTVQSAQGLSPLTEPSLLGLSDAFTTLDKKTTTGEAVPATTGQLKTLQF